MHREQKIFCEKVKSKLPDYFTKSKVLDVGSLDINGNNKYLFFNCDYIGLDIIEGKNVDVVCPILTYTNKNLYNVVISTEVLEHDRTWRNSIFKMYELLKPNGLLLITCATTGRKEHGTSKHSPKSSPATNNYYENVEKNEFLDVIKCLEFELALISINNKNHDLYFYGIKN